MHSSMFREVLACDSTKLFLGLVRTKPSRTEVYFERCMSIRKTVTTVAFYTSVLVPRGASVVAQTAPTRIERTVAKTI
ncbi:hypothetical protein BKA67DRAFT_567872 [Truncatella angustata]|uniref:Uncharacterized protein n=1 Tax=Truncatella angustata TaxID=152316 RepID=A0A9P8UIU0_9PEZI|nr:uncharacterized protein BKA67DRAFT_567872 [Truncatella angustata]KAH6652911.1 hypothetical protein BKA67DRAFT_567872 [Truncatella angustata]